MSYGVILTAISVMEITFVHFWFIWGWQPHLIAAWSI